MIRKVYTWAWLLVALAFLFSVLSGTFDAATAVIFGLVALGLIYALALWTVVMNTRETPPPGSGRGSLPVLRGVER
jgi:hypothetical protein